MQICVISAMSIFVYLLIWLWQALFCHKIFCEMYFAIGKSFRLILRVRSNHDGRFVEKASICLSIYYLSCPWFFIENLFCLPPNLEKWIPAYVHTSNDLSMKIRLMLNWTYSWLYFDVYIPISRAIYQMVRQMNLANAHGNIYN